MNLSLLYHKSTAKQEYKSETLEIQADDFSDEKNPILDYLNKHPDNTNCLLSTYNRYGEKNFFVA
jgi:hypothetical protein